MKIFTTPLTSSFLFSDGFAVLIKNIIIIVEITGITIVKLIDLPLSSGHFKQTPSSFAQFL